MSSFSVFRAVRGVARLSLLNALQLEPRRLNCTSVYDNSIVIFKIKFASRKVTEGYNPRYRNLKFCYNWKHCESVARIRWWSTSGHCRIIKLVLIFLFCSVGDGRAPVTVMVTTSYDLWLDPFLGEIFKFRNTRPVKFTFKTLPRIHHFEPFSHLT